MGGDCRLVHVFLTLLTDPVNVLVEKSILVLIHIISNLIYLLLHETIDKTVDVNFAGF